IMNRVIAPMGAKNKIFKALKEGAFPEFPEQGTEDRGPGVWMGGNIGGSLLPIVEHIRDDDWVVLELSSFMLEGLREDQWSPHIAVITNISPNHLDWHGSMENYVAAKKTIAEYQSSEDLDALVTGLVGDDWFDFPAPRHAICEAPNDEWEQCSTIPIKVPGIHNQRNFRYAQAAVQFAFKWEPHIFEKTIPAIADFSGLPHRLEYVGDFSSVKVYNDSKSTTPEAAALAIESFAPGSVRIILGGYDKGSDFEVLAKFAAGRCAGVYTIGATRDAIAGLVESAREDMRAEARTPRGARVAVERCGTLDVAVERAMRDSQPGEVIVLSPGCASWDQFANYEERGARFIELVEAYGATT
ncbi:MAG: UDP-N-acetylmuramoyl-L-alanine--D-glutamate ligase, partial [Planctomycetota bacterium]